MRSAVKTSGENPQDHPSDDLRLAYEQLGRIEILEGGLVGAAFVDVNTLANLAQEQLESGHTKTAADLLRAAEHISFAALAPKTSSDFASRVPAELKAAVAAEFDRLTKSAQRLSSESAPPDDRGGIKAIYAGALEQARDAFACGAYRPALQFARAAEALAQVTHRLPEAIPGNRTHRLAS